jgi:hypothetical protein
MASQPSNTPSPEESLAWRIFLAQPGGAWPAIGELSHVIMKVILPPLAFLVKLKGLLALAVKVKVGI